MVCSLSNKPTKSKHLIFATEMQFIKNYPKVTSPIFVVIFYLCGVFLEVGSKLLLVNFSRKMHGNEKYGPEVASVSCALNTPVREVPTI